MQLTIKEFAEKQMFLKLLLVQLRLFKNIFKLTCRKMQKTEFKNI